MITLTSSLCKVVRSPQYVCRTEWCHHHIDILPSQSCPIFPVCASDRIERLSLAAPHCLCRAWLRHMSAASAWRPVCRRMRSAAALGRLFPRWPVGQLRWLVLHHKSRGALCWIWGVGQSMCVGLCWRFTYEAHTCRSAAGDSICSQLQRTHHRPSITHHS